MDAPYAAAWDAYEREMAIGDFCQSIAERCFPDTWDKHFKTPELGEWADYRKPFCAMNDDWEPELPEYVKFEEFCAITYNHLPSKWQSIVRATESPFKYQSQATELDAFYADRLQLFKDLPQSKQEEFIGRLFNSVRDNLYAFMLSITSVDAMRVKQSGVEHELTILHHQMWETVREAMKPGLYFIADCQ